MSKSKSEFRFENIIGEKRAFAETTFKAMYTEEEQESKIEIFKEVYDQIEVCEGFCRPVTERQIEEWLRCANVEQVLRRARMHKWAA